MFAPLDIDCIACLQKDLKKTGEMNTGLNLGTLIER